MAELKEIQFLGRIVKLYTASVRVLVYHYIERGKYRLNLTNKEVSLKIAKQAYMSALGGLEEKRLVVTVRDGKIVLIEPDPGHKPIPRYQINRGRFTRSLTITSKSENINEILQSLKVLPYMKTIYGRKYKVNDFLEEDYVSVRKCDCGCCSFMKLNRDGQKTLLGWWMLFRSNLPVKGRFSTNLTNDDMLEIRIEDNLILIERSLDEVLGDLLEPLLRVRQSPNNSKEVKS